MDIKQYLRENHISIRKMSIITSIPYTTLSEIVNGKVRMEDCQYKTLKPIADFCNISIDRLVYTKEPFQIFRNNLHHDLKRYGDIALAIMLLKNKTTDYYYQNDDILKAMYVLSLVDHILKKHDLPLCSDYDFLRSHKLKEPYYVGDHSDFSAPGTFIPEFAEHNIFEGDLYDAI